MTHRYRLAAVAAVCCAFFAALPTTGRAQSHATGSFDVQVKPLPASDAAGGMSVGRMSLAKQLHGDLEGTGTGKMLTASAEEGVGAYAAIELFTGTLRGRKGTFLLVHNGTMTADSQRLNITIVPASGTGQLAGIAGKLDIKIVGGKHLYDLEYTLPGAP